MKHPVSNFLSLSFLFCFLFLISCSKDDTAEEYQPSETHFQVRLTDAPGNFSEVNIDIQQIRVHSDIDGWIDLKTNKGVYNILDFANGVDTVIAGDTIPSGTVSQIRFILGSNNNVVVDGQAHPLKVPSGSQSGLKLNVHENLTPGITYSVLVDFDAAQSIVLTGNGKYILKPVLRTIAEGIDGAIKGNLEPDGVFANILAINGTQIHGAVPDSVGNFFINDLKSGKYIICVFPRLPYKVDTLYSVAVNKGSITDVGPIYLKK